MLYRRDLLTAGATGFAMLGLARAFAGEPHPNDAARLLADPNALLDLPQGFAYRIVSRAGERMSDGLATPGYFDGMAAFAGGQGRTILVRNHELWPEADESAFPAGSPPAGLRGKLFDASATGGTTTLVLNAQGRVERSHLSLAGTLRNCGGGPTPWGSWLSCEEPRRSGAERIVAGHGWVFEVPAAARTIVDPVPLRALGRFNHEAAAVDPRTGIVYLTEDREDGLFYRFVPDRRRRLVAGGRLQACVVRETGDSANRDQGWSPGESRAAVWIDLADPHAPDDDLRLRGRAAGATRFVRGEGLALDRDGTVYMSCTEGGANAKGQIFSYRPAHLSGGTMTLVTEPRDRALLDMPDNMCVAPWGGLVVCEDGEGDNYLRLVSRTGRITTLARNAHPRRAEFCGATFGPDGRTLYVNVQRPGFTFAITGPWSQLA